MVHSFRDALIYHDTVIAFQAISGRSIIKLKWI